MDSAPADVIVVGVDGSDLALAALRWAIDEADRRGHRVRAVTVQPRGIDDQSPVTAAQVVDAAARHPHVPVEHRVVGGTIADSLLSATDDATMLVLGSHGTNPALSALLGSVTAYCVRHARTPIVLIPPALAPTRASSSAEALTPGPLF